ncbi:hypothetical protein GCM10011583_55140 [Streptomyces camponoticapitis]|uniref:Uncharacterized protein n=1 Tax=Streptomyces camponoticapitis TaxID=1616125 RepID=A0ABQ2EM36_9ACTN|nr:hypothetical protein GCM10011583_55140 [Streptomyces camponoticapitis]
MLLASPKGGLAQVEDKVRALGSQALTVPTDLTSRSATSEPLRDDPRDTARPSRHEPAASQRIVNMSSVMGRQPFARFGSYVIAMHSVSAFSDGLRQEVADMRGMCGFSMVNLPWWWPPGIRPVRVTCVRRSGGLAARTLFDKRQRPPTSPLGRRCESEMPSDWRTEAGDVVGRESTSASHCVYSKWTWLRKLLGGTP